MTTSIKSMRYPLAVSSAVLAIPELSGLYRRAVVLATLFTAVPALLLACGACALRW